MCVRVRACTCVYVFFKDTGESSEPKYEKKKEKKKIWKREGERGREFVFSLIEIIELRVYREDACHIYIYLQQYLHYIILSS